MKDFVNSFLSLFDMRRYEHGILRCKRKEFMIFLIEKIEDMWVGMIFITQSVSATSLSRKSWQRFFS